MRWVLPGGAVLDGRDERAVACRPLEAVREGRARPRIAFAQADAAAAKVGETPTSSDAHEIPAAPASGEATEPDKPPTSGRLASAKLWLEVLTLLVGLIAAVLALFGLTRK